MWYWKLKKPIRHGSFPETFSNCNLISKLLENGGGIQSRVLVLRTRDVPYLSKNHSSNINFPDALI